MSRQKMSTWTLGAIMLIVPTSFYLGTALNRHYAFTQPVPSSLPTSSSGSVADSKEESLPSSRLPAASPAIDDVAMLQSRLKSLKTARNSLEMELKDNKEKLRRLEERIKKEEDKKTGTSAS